MAKSKDPGVFGVVEYDTAGNVLSDGAVDIVVGLAAATERCRELRRQGQNTKQYLPHYMAPSWSMA